jgi:ABC-type transporter lipoprotein component MlaA
MRTAARGLRVLALAALLAASLAGCAQPVLRRDWSGYTGPGAEAFRRESLPPPDFPDPLEPWNRAVSALNHGVVVGLVDPVTQIWRVVLPKTVRKALGRAGDNLLFPRRLLANLLQAEWADAGRESARFALNTTLGVGGLFDPARRRFGLRPADEDFGQVFAVWGWRPSTFLVVPFFGPSNVRDAVGLVPDTAANPLSWVGFPFGTAANGAFTVNELSLVIDAYRRFVDSTYDPYHLSRIAHTLWRDGEVVEPRRRGADTGAVQTLESVFLGWRSDAFPGRMRRGAAPIAATGRRLPYSLWLQTGRAPIVFLVPGVGAHRLDAGTLGLAEMAFDAGFHVAALSSALNFEFMRHAATTSVPGHVPVDARDVHAALDAVARDVDAAFPGRVSARVLMGYSLGAFHAFFVAAGDTDPAGRLVRFDRIVALDAPVRLLHGLEQIDAFYDAPLSLPPAERERTVRRTLGKAVWLARRALDDDAEFSRVASADADASALSPTRPLPFSDLEARYLIGLSFRFTLQGIIAASQEREDQGVLRTPRSRLHREASNREIADYGFAEYFYAFVLPYYAKRLGADAASLVAANDLHALEPRLRGEARLRAFANLNDFVTTPDDRRWLRGVLGRERVRYFPRGGHLGNLGDPEVQRVIMDSVSDLLGRPGA